MILTQSLSMVYLGNGYTGQNEWRVTTIMERSALQAKLRCRRDHDRRRSELRQTKTTNKNYSEHTSGFKTRVVLDTLKERNGERTRPTLPVASHTGFHLEEGIPRWR